NDGACIGACTFPMGTLPLCIGYDGAHIWVGLADGTSAKIRVSDGVLEAFVPVFAESFAYDGANLWAASEDNLVKFSPNGDILQTYGAALFGGVAFDGANIWVASQSANTVSRF